MQDPTKLLQLNLKVVTYSSSSKKYHGNNSRSYNKDYKKGRGGFYNKGQSFRPQREQAPATQSSYNNYPKKSQSFKPNPKN